MADLKKTKSAAAKPSAKAKPAAKRAKPAAKAKVSILDVDVDAVVAALPSGRDLKSAIAKRAAAKPAKRAAAKPSAKAAKRAPAKKKNKPSLVGALRGGGVAMKITGKGVSLSPVKAAKISMPNWSVLPSPFMGSPKIIDVRLDDLAIMCDVRQGFETLAVNKTLLGADTELVGDTHAHANCVSGVSIIMDSIEKIGQTTPIPVVALPRPCALAIDSAYVFPERGVDLSALIPDEGDFMPENYFGDTADDGYYSAVKYLGFAGGNTRLAALRRIADFARKGEAVTARVAVYDFDFARWFVEFRACNVCDETVIDDRKTIDFVSPSIELRRALVVWGMVENTARVGLTFGQRIYPLVLVYDGMKNAVRVPKGADFPFDQLNAAFKKVCADYSVCVANAYHAIRAHRIYGVVSGSYNHGLTRSRFLADIEAAKAANEGKARPPLLPPAKRADWATLRCCAHTKQGSGAYSWAYGGAPCANASTALQNESLPKDNDDLLSLAGQVERVSRAMGVEVQIRIQRVPSGAAAVSPVRGRS